MKREHKLILAAWVLSGLLNGFACYHLGHKAGKDSVPPQPIVIFNMPARTAPIIDITK